MISMLTLLNVQDFLQKAIKGEAQLSPNFLDQFIEACHTSVRKQMKRSDEAWRLRMSGLGRPLCQQMLDKKGVQENMEYNAVLRFLFGDITEAILMLIMRQAGVNVIDAQKPCSLEIAGHTVLGTLDVIIEENGETNVWDIKSASDWAFKNKYAQGYEKLLEEDPFGYIMQGYLYSEASGYPFGGWIVVNKSSGEVLQVEVPSWRDDKAAYLKDAERRVKYLMNPHSNFVKGYTAQAETVKTKDKVVPTGNKLMPKECGFCGYRQHCWPKAVLHDKVTSRAKFPPKVWYTSLKSERV